MKGQGYVPFNSTLMSKKANQNDLEYYTQLFSFDYDEALQIFDTAGKINKTKNFSFVVLLSFFGSCI